jgi:hypothetical protein
MAVLVTSPRVAHRRSQSPRSAMAASASGACPSWTRAAEPILSGTLMRQSTCQSVVLVFCCMLLVCCGKTSRALEAGYYRGTTEADLVHDIGPPTRVVVLDPRDRSQVCNDTTGRSAVKQLEYDDPEGLSGRIRKWQGKQLYGMGVVCVDKSGKVVGTFWIQF